MTLNGNLENLLQGAAGVAQQAAERAKVAAQIAKCHMQIGAEQEKIRKLCQNLGKVYYKDYITQEEPDEAEYEPLCQQISDGYRRISVLKDTIEDLKAQTGCTVTLPAEPAQPEEENPEA